jgi:hypothetical protein
VSGGILHEVYAVELVLFWLLAAGIVFLRLRWAVLCLLLAGNVEVIHPGFVSTTTVGWQNAVEAIILPIILVLRMTNFRVPKVKLRLPVRLWVALIAYAAVSILWSQYKLSGLKMVAYLTAWLLLYIVFYLAWRRGFLDQGAVVLALWGSLALACFQSYALGNPFAQASGQFTSFTSTNSFGPFLACLLAILLFSRGGGVLRGASVAACVLALVLVGSRYALIGAFFLIFLRWLLKARSMRRNGGVRLTPMLATMAIAISVFLGFKALMARAMPESRLNQLLDLGSKPQLADVGTFGFRLMMYQRVLSQLSQRSFYRLVLGTGTSSGGAAASASQRNYDQYTVGVDPNRTIHDEFLRATYEWGLIGLGLALALCVCAGRACWRRGVKEQSLAGFAALAILPAIFLALLVENPLAGPASAEGLGYLLVLCYGLSGARTPKKGVSGDGPATTGRGPRSVPNRQGAGGQA